MTMSTKPCRVWRSLLFVPGNQPRMLAGASKRQADAVVVDLEDSVPEGSKSDARDQFADALVWTNATSDLLVRINNTPERREVDVVAAIRAGATGIVVPKAEDPASLEALAGMLRSAERRFGQTESSTTLVALIETPTGLFRLREICSATSVSAVALGDEDLALALGCLPDSSTLQTFKHQLVAAAAEAGCQPIGLACSIGEFGNLQTLRSGASVAKSWGMTGSFCIHPAQVPLLNEIFSPSTVEVENARNIVRLFEHANGQGHGAAGYQGKMIDWPIAARAYRILEIVHASKPYEMSENSGP